MTALFPTNLATPFAEDPNAFMRLETSRPGYKDLLLGRYFPMTFDRMVDLATSATKMLENQPGSTVKCMNEDGREISLPKILDMKIRLKREGDPSQSPDDGWLDANAANLKIIETTQRAAQAAIAGMSSGGSRVDYVLEHRTRIQSGLEQNVVQYSEQAMGHEEHSKLKSPKP